MAWHPQIIQRTGTSPFTDEAEFLASEKYTAKRVGATIDYTTVPVDANGHRTLRKGQVLGRITASGKYGPYDNAAADGRGVALGFSVEAHDVTHGDAVVGVIIEGSVVADRCYGLDASGKADLANHFTFQ